jgi:hypothetical protein
MIARSPASSTPAAAWPGSPELSPAMQRVLCILVVASAIKMPLGVPLYWNGGLLLLGLFAFIVVQSFPSLLLWMFGLTMLGTTTAIAGDAVAESGPRLLQLLLLVCSTAVIARLDTEVLVHYLVLLLPAMIIVAIIESLLPQPLFARVLFAEKIARQGGLLGDPNYSALLYGVIGVLLPQHWPRVLALLPFMVAIPTFSRGLLGASLVWLAAQMLGRWRSAFCIGLIVVLCLQPLLVILLDVALDEPARKALLRLSSLRSGIWFSYVELGLRHPLGVGYFRGLELMPPLAPGSPGHEAHSLFMQVFGEFGWAGYLLFVGFILHVTARIRRFVPGQLPVLVFVLTGYAFVNGLSDWAFWVPIGYVLAHARVVEGVAGRA